METLSPKTAESVDTLYSKGARLFRLSDENKPAEAKGFFDRQLSLDELLEHQERGGRLGIEPSSIDTVVVDIDHGNADRLIQNFEPQSMYPSKTQGRCHVFYRHDGARVSPQPFDAPLFRVSGDLKCARSYVALYGPQQLAADLSRGERGVTFAEVLKALVTGPPAAQGGQRRALAPPVGYKGRVGRFKAVSELPEA